MKRKVAQSSLVHIYFKNLGIVKYSKDSLYGWADLIGKLRDILSFGSWK